MKADLEKAQKDEDYKLELRLKMKAAAEARDAKAKEEEESKKGDEKPLSCSQSNQFIGIEDKQTNAQSS